MRDRDDFIPKSLPRWPIEVRAARAVGVHSLPVQMTGQGPIVSYYGRRYFARYDAGGGTPFINPDRPIPDGPPEPWHESQAQEQR